MVIFGTTVVCYTGCWLRNQTCFRQLISSWCWDKFQRCKNNMKTQLMNFSSNWKKNQWRAGFFSWKTLTSCPISDPLVVLRNIIHEKCDLWICRYSGYRQKQYTVYPKFGISVIIRDTDRLMFLNLKQFFYFFSCLKRWLFLNKLLALFIFTFFWSTVYRSLGTRSGARDDSAAS